MEYLVTYTARERLVLVEHWEHLATEGALRAGLYLILQTKAEMIQYSSAV